MPNKGLTETRIVEAAAALAEQKGLNNITLRELAEMLGVKTTSLYNHIAGVPALQVQLAALALDRLHAVLCDAAVGRAKGDAIRAIGRAYRQFAKHSPELYKAILRVPKLDDARLDMQREKVMRVFYRVLVPYGLDEEDLIHHGRLLRSALHGFVSLEAAGFFRVKIDQEESFQKMLDFLIQTLNLHGREGNG